MRHGIVVPCYNESTRLDSAAYINYARENKQNMICFVNDGSSDRTIDVLKAIKEAAGANVRICDLKVNGGKANAVRMGALYLYKKTKVETIGFLDADLSTTFKEYDSLSSEVQNYKGELKVVFGSRNLSQEGNIERNPIRKILSNIIKVLIYGITRVKIADTQCGAKVFDRELIPHIYGKTFFSRWLFDVEIILRLKKRVGKLSFLYMFLEKPLESWVHMEGSKLSFKDSILIPWNLIKIWSKYELQPARLFDLDYLSFLLNSAYSTLIRRSTTQNSIGGFLSQTR